MRINQGVEWAAHCAALLAALPAGVAMSAGRLAEFHDVPPAYLAKTMQQLAQAGIVTAVPGRRGGYRLARPAQRITLLDIVRAVDGEGPAFRCTEIRRRGPSAVPARCYKPRCGVAGAMWDAEQAYNDSLAAVTIAAIAEGIGRDAPPESLVKAASWVASTVEADGRTAYGRPSSSRPRGAAR